MDIIDAHLHPGFDQLRDAELRAYLRHEIAAGWLMTWEELNPPASYEAQTAEAVKRLAAEYPDRVLPMYAPDPAREDAVAAVRRLATDGYRGCAELKSPRRWQELDEYLAAVERQGLPLVFHMQEREPAWRWHLRRLRGRRVDAPGPFPGYLHDFSGLARALHAHPSLNFVGHGPLFWHSMAKRGKALRLMRAHRNLHADLSGWSGLQFLRGDGNTVRDFLCEFSDRLLYGTDNYAVAERLEALRQLQLPSLVRQRIFSENALRLVSGT